MNDGCQRVVMRKLTKELNQRNERTEVFLMYHIIFTTCYILDHFYKAPVIVLYIVEHNWLLVIIEIMEIGLKSINLASFLENPIFR